MMNNLKELRKRAGLTQAELAERSGVNKQMISFYEAGRNDIRKASLTTAVALATVLGVHAEELIGPKIKNPDMVIGLEKDSPDLVIEHHEISDDTRKFFETYLRAIAEDELKKTMAYKAILEMDAQKEKKELK